MAIVGQLLAKHNPNNPLLRRGVLSTQMPDTSAFKTTEELGGLSGQGLQAGIASRGYSPTSASLIQHVTDNINKVDAQHLPYAWGGGHGAGRRSRAAACLSTAPGSSARCSASTRAWPPTWARWASPARAA
jgi:hypothetical protein